MKFKVYNEGKSEKTTYFNLEESFGGIKLIAKDSNEFNDWTILEITKHGFLRTYAFIEKEIGLQLDENSRIIQEKE